MSDPAAGALTREDRIVAEVLRFAVGSIQIVDHGRGVTLPVDAEKAAREIWWDEDFTIGETRFAGRVRPDAVAAVTIVANVLAAAGVPQLIGLLSQCRALVVDEIDCRLRSVCLSDADGKPLRASLSPEHAAFVEEVEQLLAQIDAALPKES